MPTIGQLYNFISGYDITGESAYDIWKSLGNEGGQAEFLESLKPSTELNNQISQLSTRMDMFTKLEEGSTTGDAELQDIRVGADGVTYPSAGSAVRTQITDLKSDMESLDFNIRENIIDVVYENRTIMLSSVGMTNGYYVQASDGTLQVNPSFSASDYIDLTDVTDVKSFRALGIQQSAFYDENKKYLASLGVTGTITTETEYAVPEGAKYIRFSVYNNYKDSAYYIIPAYRKRKVKIKTSDLENDAGFVTQDFLSIKEQKCMFKDINLLNNTYVDKSNGKLYTVSGFSATDYIDLTDVKSFRALGIQQSAFYDENKVYLTPLNVSSVISTETVFSVPEGAKYIRFSVYNNYKDSAYYIIPGFIINNFKLSDFENDVNISPIFYIGANREYKTLRSGIAKAISKRNSIVYVDYGVYDLCEEFSEEIANKTYSQYGIKLANNVHIIFSSGAKVKALCDEVHNNIEVCFAPFYCEDDSDFTLENLDIESKNTRYCVHDECGGTTGTFTHRYINCKMNHDNSSSYSTRFPQCIGGGLGQHIYIDIVGCYFKSKICETQKNRLYLTIIILMLIQNLISMLEIVILMTWELLGSHITVHQLMFQKQ